MKVYTYSQARQKLAKLLDEARREGEAQIKRRDGQTFIIKPAGKEKSPLNVPGINAGINLEELNNAVRESRKRTA